MSTPSIGCRIPESEIETLPSTFKCLTLAPIKLEKLKDRGLAFARSGIILRNKRVMIVVNLCSTLEWFLDCSAHSDSSIVVQSSYVYPLVEQCLCIENREIQKCCYA